MYFAIKLTKGLKEKIDITKLSDYDYRIYRIFMSIIAFLRFRGVNKHKIHYHNKKQLHCFIGDNIVVLYHEKNSFSNEFIK